MCFWYDDTCEVWNETWRKARKEHRCDECAGAILPGERYLSYRWICQGEPGSFKECAKCRTVREIIADREKAEGCTGSEIWAPLHQLSEAIDDDAPERYGLMTYHEDIDDYTVDPRAAHLFPMLRQHAHD